MLLDNGKLLTPGIFARAIGIRIERAEKWHGVFKNATQRFGIEGTTELASFFAQVAHESGLLSVFEENLNYSATGLASTWPSRFKGPDGKPNVKAMSLARKPQMIANEVYANRMGNGSQSTNDGWNFRGRGPIQITGKSNYRDLSNVLEVDLVGDPSKLLLPHYGALSACWFWETRGLDRFDDDKDVKSETRIINGGAIGLKHRQELFNQIYCVFTE